MKKSKEKNENIEVEEDIVKDENNKDLDALNVEDSADNEEDGDECAEDVLLEGVLEGKSDGEEAEEDVDSEQNDDKKLADEYLAKLQGLQAEFDNFRKREEKQRLLLKDIITENVVQDILPVIDNFERATHAAKDDNTTLESFVEGINLVYQQFEGFLTNLNIEKMEALGEKFDPEKHDAVSKAANEEYEEDIVSGVLQNGWVLNDKVIRHAMVVVSSGSATE